MHKTLFSRELRLFLCPNCGAPIEGAIAGGALSCRFCNATATLAPRDESRDLAIAAVQPAVSEAERFQRLREQDHKPLMPPPSVQHLLVNGSLPPELVPQAFADLQRARQEVAAGAGFGSAERLYFLTMLLYSQLSSQHKEAEVRALLETARDLLTDPRHRQVIHGMLARNAARAGDPAAAEEWLRLCNPHAADIQMDTAYRFSRAYASTRNGDFQTVLRALGTQIDDVPIADGQDEVCGMLRANALERTGQVQVAAQQLAQIASSHPAGAAVLNQIALRNAELGLCPQSLPLAYQQMSSMSAGAVRTRSGFNIGAIIGLSIGTVVVGVILDFIAWAVVPITYVAAVHVPLIIGTIALTFVVTFGGIARANAAKRQLLATGTPGRARIMAVNETGVRINNQPMLELNLQIQLPGRAPYLAIHREVVSQVLLARVAPGGNVGVRVHPTDPTLMTVDWQQG